MLSFRAHVHRQGSRWTWEVRQGRGATASRRTGTTESRAEAMRAAFTPARAVQEQHPPQSHRHAA